MSFDIGLVGKPSVGKSTLFNAATMNDVPEGAYPFTTIDPSVGEAYVRVDCAAPEFDHARTPNTGYCDDGVRFVPVRLVDVANLVPGAHEGRGLGNQFLTDLNEADVLVHVVDFSGTTDIEGEATEGHDPARTSTSGERTRHVVPRRPGGASSATAGYEGEEKAIEADLATQMSAFRTNEDEIKQVILSLDLELDPEAWEDADKSALAREIRKRTKPMVVAANKMDTPAAKANFEAITSDPDYDHLTVVPTSAHAEKALKNGDEQDVLDYRPGDEGLRGDGGRPEEKKAAGLEQIRESSSASSTGRASRRSSRRRCSRNWTPSRCSPARASRKTTAPSSRTASSSRAGRRPRTSRTSSTRTSATGSSTPTTSAPGGRWRPTRCSTTVTWSRSRRRTDTPP